MIPIRNAVPSRYPPVITWMLIVTNCLVFLFQDSLSRAHSHALHRLCIRETELAAIDILPFSMMFLHGGWLRLILNMQTLWLFGPTIDDRWVMAAVWCSISLAAWRLRSRTSCSIRLRSCPH